MVKALSEDLGFKPYFCQNSNFTFVQFIELGTLILIKASVNCYQLDYYFCNYSFEVT